MRSPFWSIEQLQAVRELFATHTARQIAEKIGKPVGAVYQCADILDLPSKQAPRKPFNTRQAVAELHAQGKYDSEIAVQLGLDRRYVTSLRLSQGLPAIPLTPEKRLQAVLKQRQTMGISCSTELRKQAHRRYAREHGLPEHIRFRAVQVAYALARHGPMTRRQICSVLGWKWQSVRKCGLNANDKQGVGRGTYLAELVTQGIVLRHRRAVKTGRQGGNRDLYDLTPLWRERITDHVRQKSTGAAGPAT